MEMCRACLSSGMNLTTMDESFVHNYNLLTSLDIKYNETPIYLCDICLEALKFCIDFREKCITSDITLKQILFPDENIKLEESNYEMVLGDDVIKEEAYDDDDIDDAKYLIIPEDDDQDWETTIRKSTRLKKRADKVVKPAIKEKNIKEVPIKKQVKILKQYKSDDKITHCGLCEKTFEDTEKVISHLSVHKMSAVCLLCHMQCISYPHLLSHRLAHLPSEQRGCLFCNKKYSTQAGLEYHYLKAHNICDENTHFLCKVCLCKYDTPIKLRKHMRSVHSTSKHICENCKMEFKTRSALKTHMQKHNDGRKYECGHCDYRSNYSSGLQVHILRHHTKSRAYCKICTRVFKDQEHLDKHYPCKYAVLCMCPVCGTNFKNSVRLNRHMKSHSDEKSFKCDKCDAQFKARTAYRVHMDKHAGVKRHQCEYCSKSFYTPSVLVKHRRVHTGEKPYVCSICTKAFTGKNNLKVHMRVHGIDLIVKKTDNKELGKHDLSLMSSI